MKINEKTQLGLYNDSEERKESYEYYVNHNSSILNSFRNNCNDGSSLMTLDKLILDELILKNDFKYFLFTKKSLTIAENINIEKFTPSLFERGTTERKKYIILVSETEYYRIIMDQSGILAYYTRIDNIGLCNDIIYFDPNLDYSLYAQYQESEYFTKLVKLLIYFQYSDLTYIRKLPPNHTYSKNVFDTYSNKTTSDIIIVDTNWNKVIFVAGKFNVRGHFRLQACGEEFKNRKLIYIDEFEKNGYTRRAGRDLNAA